MDQNFNKRNYEIIVVDDGSTDDTKEIVSKFKKAHYFKIKHGGPSKARNFGVKKSSGDIVVFTDAGCVPKKNWLMSILKPFEDNSIHGVSGTYETLNKESWIARFVGFEIDQRHEKMKKLESIDFIGTYSCAYRKKTFLKFGGFSTSFTSANAEDPDFSYRLSKAGYKLVFEPKAIVLGDHPESLWKYLIKKKSRAYWKVMLFKRNPEKTFGDSYTPRHLMPQILFTGIFLSTLLISIVVPYFLFLSLISFFISISLNMNFYKFLFKKEKKLILPSFAVFTLRNIFSVLGIIHGLIDFLLRKN